MNRQTRVAIKQRAFQVGLLLGALFLASAITPRTLAEAKSGAEASAPGTAEWVWQNPRPQGNFLHGISFVDANNAFAVGDDGTIIRTTNGGHKWTIQPSKTTNGLYGVSFV